MNKLHPALWLEFIQSSQVAREFGYDLLRSLVRCLRRVVFQPVTAVSPSAFVGVPVERSIALGVRRNALEIVQRYQQPLDNRALKGELLKFRQSLDVGIEQAAAHWRLL